MTNPVTRLDMPIRCAKPTAPRTGGRDFDAGSANVEVALLDAVRKIQEDANADTRRLRDAMQQAVEILQNALRQG